MADHDSAAAIRAWASERRLPQAHLARWLAMDERDRASLLSIARSLKLRTGAMVVAIATLEEIALREACSIESVLARDDLARMIRGSDSTPARAKAFLDALRVIRHPRLTDVERGLRERIAALGLPRGISIELPKDLASDELRIELRASGGTELRRLIEALGANAAQLAEICDLLGGET